MHENSTDWANVSLAFSCFFNLNLDLAFFLLITLIVSSTLAAIPFLLRSYPCTDMLTENFHQTQSVIATTDLLNWSFVLGVLTTSPPVQARLCEDKSQAADTDISCKHVFFLSGMSSIVPS